MKSFLQLAMAVVIFGVCVYAQQGRVDDNDNDIIDYVNNHEQASRPGGWKAKSSHLSVLSLEEKKKLGGAIFPTAEMIQSHPRLADRQGQRHCRSASCTIPIPIPDTFDARAKWPQCPSIGEVRNQGECGNCWANAGASVITDRICIGSGVAATQFHVSVQDITVCPDQHAYPDDECACNYLDVPFQMWQTHGVVTGGNTGINTGCMPYSLATPNSAKKVSPSCPFKCTNPLGYKQTYLNDKNFGASWYVLGNLVGAQTGGASGESVVRQIQYELMTNGPISTQFDLYDDFNSYLTGIYRYVSGPYIGAHAMKLIGWGTTAGVDYWLLVNSWDTTWGTNGTVKFIRGINHCKIEDYLIAGLSSPNKNSEDKTNDDQDNDQNNQDSDNNNW